MTYQPHHQPHRRYSLFKSLLFIIGMMIFGGCGTGIPNVTPTLLPTATPLQETEIAIEPSNTPIIRLSPTPIPSLSPQAIASVSPSVSPTAIPSEVASTQTPLPTPSPEATPTPSLTPLPLPNPSETPTTPPTANYTPTSEIPTSPSATMIPSATFTPSTTFTPTIDGTRISQLLQTQAAQLTIEAQQTIAQQPTQVAQVATFTAVAIASPTITLAPIQATPTLITATPGGEELGIILQSPVPSTPVPQPSAVDAPTSEADVIIPTPTLAFPTPLPPDRITTGFVTPLPPPVFNTQFDVNIAAAFTFNGRQSFNFNGQELQGGISLFASNPVYPESFARTLPSGLLIFAPPGGVEQPFNYSPFYDGYDAFDAQSNKNYVSDIVWSPDGLKMAFLITPPTQSDKIAAGVWFWQPEQSLSTDPTYPLLHDCPAGNWTSCGLVQGRPANYWQSIKMTWSPDSTRLLVTLQLPEEGRQAITVLNAVRDSAYANNAPIIARYDSGSWLPDGRLLVSGRRPSDGRVIIGRVNADFTGEEVIFDATQANLWVQDAVQRPDGVIVAFGRECCPGGALRLVQANGTPISNAIGNTTPQRIEWAQDNTSAVVTVENTQYLVNAYNGSINRINAEDGFIQIANTTGAVVQNPIAGGDQYPDGIVSGSVYSPGQQVHFTGDFERNLRNIPSINDSVVIGSVIPSEFVAIVAGPYENDGFVWWQVINARDITGWIAAESDGVSLFDP